MKPTRASVRRAWIGAVLFAAIVLCVGGWVGYSFYTYRTFTGNPNVYPSYVKVFGTVKTETFVSRALGRSMSYDVYLPPGYNDPRSADARYPVVYLLHGDPGSYDDWVTVGGIDEKMDALLAREEVRPMIVVMPQGSPSRFARPTEYIDGPRGRWETYVTKDLMRHVDSSYRTVDSASGRAIAGLSEGGYGAVNLGLRNPDEFALAGSFSGYFALSKNDGAVGGDASLADANSPAEYLPNLMGPLPRIYMYVGESDGTYVSENARFADKLRAKGASHEFRTYPGTHSWDLWRSRLPDFLAFASRNLQGRA